jgi:ribonuclease R
MPKRQNTGLPSRQKILDFITTSPTSAGKREIAKAFGLHGADKIALKALLKDMADEGLIDSAPGRAFHKMGGLPKVTVLRIVAVEDDQVIGVPEIWHGEGIPVPRLRVIEKGRRSALGVGDRVLVRTEERGQGHVALPMKQLAASEASILGIVALDEGKHWLRPVDKRERHDTLITDLGGAKVGDLVRAEKAGRVPRITARVVEVLGDPFAPRAFSLVAIHKLGIPDVFPDEVLVEAEAVLDTPIGEREDLRHLPIVAIDPADARDHDDAVWAASDGAGGFSAIVAIADVSFYVRPGSALDREAKKRGNSVYFPDRVVPMLPETLSADKCSLKAGQDRAAIVCHLTITNAGKVTESRFTRAVIRVAANIAYEDAQAAIDGAGGAKDALLDTALRPLWACWALLAKARDAREPLDLDLPERRVVLDENGRITSIAERERLDAHRLIEDFMIAANVAAAKALEAKKAPCMYRVHEPPSREKLTALKDYLETFEVPFALGQVITPKVFNHIIKRVGDADFRPQVMEQILRTQTQAYYAPINQGHFGLSLGSYGHFTSPIRRYADLLVHRALVGAYGLGDGALTEAETGKMVVLGEMISQTERRAMEAERETVDRYVAAFLSERVGEILDTRITGVTKFGFFATVEGIGGDGLVPVSTLGAEYFRHEEMTHRLIGETTGEAYTLGQRIKLRLAEANPASGGLRFELPEGGSHLAMPRGDRRDRVRRPVAGKRGRPGNIRHQGRR